MPRGKPGVEVRQPEVRLLSEYLAATYPKDRIQLQPRLGGVQPELQNVPTSWGELRMLGVWRRYPDAAVFLRDRVVLLEASVRPEIGKISMLDLYAHLFPLTPEFADFAKLPVEKVAVWGIPDLAGAKIAQDHGVKVVLFQPAWLVDYVKTFDPRFQRASRTHVS